MLDDIEQSGRLNLQSTDELFSYVIDSDVDGISPRLQARWATSGGGANTICGQY